MPLRLGVIADDFTGATDVANALVRAGMRVVQLLGLPATGHPATGPGVHAAEAARAEDPDAIVVALKTRTVPPAEAIAESLAALAWLRAAGAEQVYFKYCSTFDSTPTGNIGPVTEALLEALGSDFTIATPAFPGTGRTVFQGHLFVGDLLLSESGMRHHPLTPMTDSNLVRVLQAQCRGRVGLVPHGAVAAGPGAIRARFAALRAAGVRVAIVDVVTDADLAALGPALADLPLVTAGSGVATALPANWGITPSPAAVALPPPVGAAAVIAGSVSPATNAQVADLLAGGAPGYAVDPLRIAAGADVVGEALAFAAAHRGPAPILVHSTAGPEVVARVQRQLGTAQAAGLVEATLAEITAGLVGRPELGVRQLVVAGGETAGAVLAALGVAQLRIGPQIDPGVPWCLAWLPSGQPLHLALKSGNFGAVDFFSKAFALLH